MAVITTSSLPHPAPGTSTSVELYQTLHTRPDHPLDQPTEHQGHHHLDTDLSRGQDARSSTVTMSSVDASSAAPITNVMINKTTDKATRAIHMFALEIALLQYPLANTKIDQGSKNRLMTIIDFRRSQAIARDPALFAQVLAAKRSEWNAHWNQWSPWAVHPSYASSQDEEEERKIKRAKTNAITRFATEVIVLEFHCVNDRLEDDAIRAVMKTIDRCQTLARGIDAVWYEGILATKREEWMSHWLEWASFDQQGRLEFGSVHGTEDGAENDTESTPANLMVGNVVMLERKDDGKDEPVEAEDLAETVRAAFERLRVYLLLGR
ncbi:hypothetical protein SLS60_002611 [Paraconiothyrium brasiliense]|uniref:Uncharacterized protein n=1 Tax=Paraconiothyrium brasiliense TaxID=300254 RepID=A0ABR3RTA7_9PLEO